MSKKIIILFDGTWNMDDSFHEVLPLNSTNTNVRLFKDALLALDDQGNPQCIFYESGVGTDWYNRLSGGIFGIGLSAKIRDAYAFLATQYEDGDQVYLLGFSRGAYSARSLAGWIRNTGLLYPIYLNDYLASSYELYRTRDEGPDSPVALTYRHSRAREIPIHFLGVWETVGTLGVPFHSFGDFNSHFFDFHDTRLARNVKHAYQAVAIDEHRDRYPCTLWNPTDNSNQVIEQVWFAGCHSNIGGGYRNHHLSDISLQWMMAKAMQHGLAFDPQLVPNPDYVDCQREDMTVIDSFQHFLGGYFALLSKRFYRAIGNTTYGHEAIHPSVVNRLQIDKHYRPRNPIGEYLTGTFKPHHKLYDS